MRRTIGIFWGILLIGGGTLLLLQNLGYLGNVPAYLWAFVFAVFGISFLIGFIIDRTHWWALIPGVTLLSLAALVGLSEANEGLAETWGGTLFLGGIGLAFWLVYLMLTRARSFSSAWPSPLASSSLPPACDGRFCLRRYWRCWAWSSWST
jgi:hypothetical protein